MVDISNNSEPIMVHYERNNIYILFTTNLKKHSSEKKIVVYILIKIKVHFHL